MYEFYHKYIKIKFSANLFFTGLDSLVYEIKRDDVYEDFFEDKHWFDFSDYPRYSKFFLILLIKKLFVKWKANSKQR